MLNDDIILFLLGMFAGYLIMTLTSNITTYHGMNSNDIRTKIFESDGKKYKFIPHVITEKK